MDPQAVAVLQYFLRSGEIFILQHSLLSRRESQQVILLPLGKIDRLRGPELGQKGRDFPRPEPLALGEPEKIFQVCHREPPFRSFSPARRTERLRRAVFLLPPALPQDHRSGRRGVEGLAPLHHRYFQGLFTQGQKLL